jgi:Tn7-like transposition protein D
VNSISIKFDPKVYAWLYLYDREFLMEHMPEKMLSKAGFMRYDWETRDQEILKLVTEIVQDLINKEGKPKRITLKRIQEILGKQCLMPKHLRKMPLTKAYLEQTVEDSESFRKRRVLWALRELKSNDESLTLNRLKLKAGISRIPEEYLLELTTVALKEIPV